jgi:hypothetical protein
MSITPWRFRAAGAERKPLNKDRPAYERSLMDPAPKVGQRVATLNTDIHTWREHCKREEFVEYGEDLEGTIGLGMTLFQPYKNHNKRTNHIMEASPLAPHLGIPFAHTGNDNFSKIPNKNGVKNGPCAG